MRPLRTLACQARTTFALLAALMGVVSRPAAGQELYALFGGEHTKDPEASTYSYSYQYLQNVTEHLIASYTYLNEGHVPNHHRDGHSLQIWYRWLTPEQRFTFALGVGPYRFYDTTMPEGSENTTDLHGWGVMASAMANWYFHYPWVAEARYNYVHTNSSITTNTYLIGLGYQFDPKKGEGPVVPPASYGFATPERNEVSLLIGQSILNNFQSPKGAAWAVEYRYRFTPYVDFTGTWLDEGDEGQFTRKGIAAMAWLRREFLDQHAEVAIGFGPYLARDNYGSEGVEHTNVQGLLTVLIGYRWSERWGSRFYWYRTVTNNSTATDSDVIFLSLGYSF